MGDNRRNIRFEDDIKKISLGIWEKHECPICHRIFYVRKKYSKITCSKDCYEKYMEQHKDEINEKRRIASYNSYHSKTKEEIGKEHEKARKTCLERYGVDMYQKTDEYRKKMSEKFKKKDWSERSKKVVETLIVKYRQICENDNLELVEFRNRFDCTVKCRECGNVFDVHVLGYLSDSTTHNLCRHCHPNVNPTGETYPLKFVENILIENNITYIKNDRTLIKPYEIDLYVPSLKIGFEVNGNYWHSEFSCNKDKSYHVGKTRLSYDKGIKLIQIFEDEITNKPEIVRSRILNLLKLTNRRIYARKCELRELSAKDKKDFLNSNHIDGDSISKYNYGLYYGDEIVSVATFGKRKISGKEQFELIRFANKVNVNVVGGFSKLLKHFITEVHPMELVTYADIRWSGMDSEDNVYRKSGFIFEKYTKPNYFYVDKKNYRHRINRLNFTKQKLVKMGYDKDKTEIQIMLENGYDRIWDCGSMKFRYNKNGE